MNTGLLRKTLTETWALTAGIGVGLFLVGALIAYALPEYQAELVGSILRISFLRSLVGALLGVEVTEAIADELVDVLPWIHPLVLTLYWVHGITFLTRFPAGEVDRGTADVFLALPVSRNQILRAELVVCSASLVVLVAANWLGTAIGALAAGRPLPEFGRLLPVCANLYALLLAVGGATTLISCVSSRRGRAVGAAVTVVLGSFLLNFVAQFFAPLAKLGKLSLLTYYRPVESLPSGTWPLGHITVLLACACIGVAGGAAVIARRGIQTT